MIQSMTGFATATHDTPSHTISVEMRGVNNRGLDLKIRVPDGIDGLEQSIRSRVAAQVKRGSITVTIRLLTRAEAEPQLALNKDMLGVVLSALGEIEQSAMDHHVNLAPSTATDILALRGILDVQDVAQDTSDALKPAIEAACDAALAMFIQSRQDEGRALADVLHRAITDIEIRVTQATALLPERQSKIETTFNESLKRLLSQSVEIDQDRVAQEIATLLIKQDVQEEIDRLNGHITAARDLLADGGAIGRRFDFLTQEFNREANTLCSKAQHNQLTQVGLELKTIIDQIREQVQNVE